MTKVTLADWVPTEKQIKMVNDVVKSGRLTYGPYTRMLEGHFARLHNFKHAIFTNSGTSALQVSLDYLKQKHGWEDFNEVIIPAVTFVATVNVVLQNNLKPVLVDIDLGTLNIDTDLIESKITPLTVAIMPVDLLGRPCDIEPIRKLAKKYDLKIVEDSCETMFVNHPTGGPVGSKADIACYSSYLAHIASTGVGGFICTNDKAAADYMRSMIWHGRDNLYLSIDANDTVAPEKLLHARFSFNKQGYSYRLTEMEAALGIDELERGQEIVAQRDRNATDLYNLLLPFQKDSYIHLPFMFQENAWMFFPIICLDGVDRDKLALFLEKKGIQTRFIMPLTNQPVYEGIFDPNDYPMADYINKNGLLLGIHHFLTEKEISYIAECFKEYFS